MKFKNTKIEKASWIAGIVSAVLGTIALFYSMWPKYFDTTQLNVTQSASSVGTQIGNVTGNVTVVNATTSSSIPEYPTTEKPIDGSASTRFLGALDGRYEAKGNLIEIQWSDRSFSLIQGECSLIGTIVEKNTYWSVVATRVDGVCPMLDSHYFGREVGEIRPERGAVAGSGRVLMFLLSFQPESLAPLSGTYELRSSVKSTQTVPVVVGDSEQPELDACASLAAVKARVTLRSGPGENYAKIGSLNSGVLVYVCSESPDKKWYGIVLQEGMFLDCETSSPASTSKHYDGLCASGWLPIESLEIIAG